MPPLKPSQLQNIDQVLRTHHVTVEGTKLEDMLKPDYWRLAAPHLHLSDRIKVEAMDGSFFAELSVRDLGKTWAKVKVCNEKHHEPDQEESEDAWQSEFKVAPSYKGYVVRHNSNNAAAAGPFANQEDAVNAARDLHRR